MLHSMSVRPSRWAPIYPHIFTFHRCSAWSSHLTLEAPLTHFPAFCSGCLCRLRGLLLLPQLQFYLFFKVRTFSSIEAFSNVPCQNQLFPSLVWSQHIPFVQKNKLTLKVFLLAWHLLASEKPRYTLLAYFLQFLFCPVLFRCLHSIINSQ